MSNGATRSVRRIVARRVDVGAAGAGSRRSLDRCDGDRREEPAVRRQRRSSRLNQLWRSDGTGKGTKLLKDIGPRRPLSSYPAQFTRLNSL